MKQVTTKVLKDILDGIYEEQTHYILENIYSTLYMDSPPDVIDCPLENLPTEITGQALTQKIIQLRLAGERDIFASPELRDECDKLLRENLEYGGEKLDVSFEQGHLSVLKDLYNLIGDEKAQACSLWCYHDFYQ